MRFLILTVIVLVVAVAVYISTSKLAAIWQRPNCKNKVCEWVYYNEQWLRESAGVSVVAAIALVVELLIIANNAFGLYGLQSDQRKEYDKIIAHIESGYCSYDSCVIDEAVQFNYERSKHLRWKESEWFGVFYSDKYEGIPEIDLQSAVDSEHNGHTVVRMEGD